MANPITLNAQSAENQLIELVSKLQILEGAEVTNPDNVNRITGTFNQDTKNFTGTFNIPCNIMVDANGNVGFEALVYLIDAVREVPTA